MRALTVAAVQMKCRNGEIEGNLRRAGRWANEAARQGAQLVLLPELFSTGFELNENAWRSAEPQGGPTEQWLAGAAREHGFLVGGSYLEARGDDFFNTFVLAGPDGRIVGRVRKSHPCSLEAYVFAAGHDCHVLETDLGRVGVAICYEGSLRAVWDDILANDPDLVLMPMSAPSPAKSLLYRERRIAAYHASFRDGATQCAEALGIPHLMANKWGEWVCDLPSFWPRMRSRFPGFSHIADSDGRELARVEQGEGVIVAKVRLDPVRKRLVLPPEKDVYKPWVAKVPGDYKLFRWFEALGRRWYARHPGRARAARAIQGIQESPGVF